MKLEADDNHVIIRPARDPRSGWDEAFAQMAEKGDDARLEAATPVATEWDKTEWRW